MVRETVDDVETALADLAMVVGPITRAALYIQQLNKQ